MASVLKIGISRNDTNYINNNFVNQVTNVTRFAKKCLIHASDCGTLKWHNFVYK